ncbi:MAG: metalloregulator ArsR/SmtB family transcription factor [Dehalococcoidales bacterium]|nr:metalloregulator ArsR/SmtB family transcription factor [Dehalococcoidales bacterium]
MPKYDREFYIIKAELCKALADPSRQMMIVELRSGEKTVGELSETLEISQPATSRHLAILRDGGVVKARRENTNIYYSLVTPKIAEACDMVQAILFSQMEKNRDLANRIITT